MFDYACYPKTKVSHARCNSLTGKPVESDEDILEHPCVNLHIRNCLEIGFTHDLKIWFVSDTKSPPCPNPCSSWSIKSLYPTFPSVILKQSITSKQKRSYYIELTSFLEFIIKRIKTDFSACISLNYNCPKSLYHQNILVSWAHPLICTIT